MHNAQILGQKWNVFSFLLGLFLAQLHIGLIYCRLFLQKKNNNFVTK